MKRLLEETQLVTQIVYDAGRTQPDGFTNL